MKQIPLTQGKVALVDDEDYEELSRYKWYVTKGYSTDYAIRSITTGCRRQGVVRMHRVIMKTPSDLFVDHINGNGLDNRKANLRNCTREQNSRNVKTRNTIATGFKGVHYRHVNYGAGCYITAKINHKKRQIHLGYFHDLETAAKAYDMKARELFGEFANLNFPSQSI